MRCEYPLNSLELDEMERIIRDFESRQGKVRTCIKRRNTFRTACRHPATRDQKHADDDERVVKLGDDCLQYIEQLKSILSQKWEQLQLLRVETDKVARQRRQEAAQLSKEAAQLSKEAETAEAIVRRIDQQAKQVGDIATMRNCVAAQVESSSLQSRSSRKRANAKGKGKANAQKDVAESAMLQEAMENARKERRAQRLSLLEELRTASGTKFLMTMHREDAYDAFLRMLVGSLYEHIGLPEVPLLYDLKQDIYRMLDDGVLSNHQLLGLISEVKRANMEKLISLDEWLKRKNSGQ